MQFSVGQLLKEPIGSTRTYTLEETVDPLEDGHEEPVRGQVRFMRMDKGIWVLGTLDTGAPGVCSRCLVSFTQSIRLFQYVSTFGRMEWDVVNTRTLIVHLGLLSSTELGLARASSLRRCVCSSALIRANSSRAHRTQARVSPLSSSYFAMKLSLKRRWDPWSSSVVSKNH